LNGEEEPATETGSSIEVQRFLAGAFFAGVFLAGAFLAATFFAALTGGFLVAPLAGAFVGATFLLATLLALLDTAVFFIAMNI
jgi:hypothetical protein